MYSLAVNVQVLFQITKMNQLFYQANKTNPFCRAPLCSLLYLYSVGCLFRIITALEQKFPLGINKVHLLSICLLTYAICRGNGPRKRMRKKERGRVSVWGA